MEADHIINDLIHPGIKQNSPRERRRGAPDIAIPIDVDNKDVINIQGLSIDHKVIIRRVCVNHDLRDLLKEEERVMRAHRDLHAVAAALGQVPDGVIRHCREGFRPLPADRHRDAGLLVVAQAEVRFREFPDFEGDTADLLCDIAAHARPEVRGVAGGDHAVEPPEDREEGRLLEAVEELKRGEVHFELVEGGFGGFEGVGDGDGGDEGVLGDMEAFELEAAEV